MDQVILAFQGERTSARVRDIIEAAGLAECLICHSAAEVKRLVYTQSISTVICGYKLQDETALELSDDLPNACSMLVIGVQNMLDMIDSDNIFKLPSPVAKSDLVASVRMLLQLGHRMERRGKPERSQEEKAIIQRAKGTLMEQYGMSEDQAHRFLQKKSMDSGIKLIQAAQMVLDELLDQLL